MRRPTRWTSIVVGAALALATAPMLGIGPADATPRAVQDVVADPTHAPGTYRPVQPWRVLDTRTGAGAPQHAVAAGATVTFSATGHAGVPAAAEVASVALNLTATGATAGGHITAYPAGTARPGTSSLNYERGVTRANLAIVPVSSTGQVSLYNGSGGSVQLLADIEGYYLAGTPTEPGAFVSLHPARLLDTRNGTGAPAHAIGPAGNLDVIVSGHAGVPTGRITAVVLNLTVTQPAARGFLTVHGAHSSVPNASNLNFVAGQTVANLATVDLGTDGDAISIYNGSSGSTQVIADVVGYYLLGTPTAVGAFALVIPAHRVLDTRHQVGTTGGALASHHTLDIQTAVPAGSSAVLLNVTAVEGKASGYLAAPPQIYPHEPGAAVSRTSTLSYAAGAIVANQVAEPLSSGRAPLFNGGSRLVHVLADVSGYWIGPSMTWAATSAVDAGHALRDVSCAAASVCLAVDGDGRAVRYDGSSWSAPVQVFAAGDHAIAISCPTTTFCLAVANGATTGSYATFNGSTWSAPAALGDAAGSVDCVSPTFCLAAVATHARTFNGVAWTDHSPAAGLAVASINAVSCVSATFCMAVDEDAQETVWNGSAWTTPQQAQYTDKQVALFDVSCVSTTHCVAVGDEGSYLFDGSHWNVVIANPTVTNISCAVESFCAATSAPTSVSVFSGGGWLDTTDLGASNTTAVSCPTAHFCVTVDDSGHATRGAA